jgi:hypothetical protein
MIIYGTTERQIFTRRPANLRTWQPFTGYAWVRGSVKDNGDGTYTAWVTDPDNGQIVKRLDTPAADVELVDA